MQQDYNEESFKKGEQFEKYVEENIFPDAHYEVIHKTSDSEQNRRRFVKKSLEPDFHFKCRVTGKEFYVEAKWRAKPYKDLYQVLSEKQFETFPKLHSSKRPIYIAFGYGGQASNPDYVSLIPLEQVRTSKLSPREVHSFNIEKAHYPPSRFTKKEKTTEAESGQKKNQTCSHEEKRTAVKKGLKQYNSKVLALAAVGVLTIFTLFYGFAFSNKTSEKTPADQLQAIITDYYQAMNSNQIEKLPEFLSPQVTSWYGEQNPSREWIYRNARAHRGKYPYSSSDIDWDSFRVIPAEAGGYTVTYEMIYRSKEKITDDYTVYDLKLLTQWDENFKLRGITEIRN
ncbi:hypothetical protein ACXYMT_05155 [Salinimicrobium sp. CAU 1759]